MITNTAPAKQKSLLGALLGPHCFYGIPQLGVSAQGAAAVGADPVLGVRNWEMQTQS